MRDIKDLCARIEDELSKIADNGLTTGNLEMTYKLIDMYKDIKNTQYWDKKVEYFTTLFLMRCVVADTMTITVNVEESATVWGDTVQMMAE